MNMNILSPKKNNQCPKYNWIGGIISKILGDPNMKCRFSTKWLAELSIVALDPNHRL
jgi:hypothetical protein